MSALNMRVMLLLTALVLGACAAQGPTLNAQAEQMELALVECKAQLGLDGQLKTEVSFDGGVASAIAVAFDKISAADADRINSCALGAESLSDGLLVVPMTAMEPQGAAFVQAPVAPAQSELPAAIAPTPAAVTNGACPAGVTGMYGGTLYCGTRY